MADFVPGTEQRNPSTRGIVLPPTADLIAVLIREQAAATETVVDASGEILPLETVGPGAAT